MYGLFAPDGGHSLVDTDTCPVCEDMRVDGVCPWENHSDESLMQAMTIDAAGGGVAWAEKVLAHDWFRQHEMTMLDIGGRINE